ncbi:MAG TPA: TonB-dependent receptor plug domain-containing protein [Candidatus Didemnitutus sp.]|nr:TonB-dependent receptor plug domain-containing protein [Candidatus Didemnitutus sp.]
MHPRKTPALVAVILTTFCSAISQAQTVPPGETTPGATGDKVVVLDPFQVNTANDYGYRKLTSITTSRIGVAITEAPQAIEVISGEMLHDFDISSIRDAFNYSSSITKNSEEVLQSGSFKLRGFQLPTFINGMAQPPGPSNPGYISNDNVERIEVAKGPVGLFFGNSAPNGVANIITKRPQMINRTTVSLGGGSYGYEKAMLDTQAVVSKDLGIAYRLITSADDSHTRIGQDTSYNMVAGSVLVHPNDKVRFEAEFDATNFQQSYAANNAWNFVVNPLYYQNVTNPDQTMLNYIKTKYGAATDAAAISVINSRWGVGGPTSYVNNWATDYFGAYGKIVYPHTGTTMPWSEISPLGDSFTGAGPDSNDDGTTYLADASLVITPTDKTAIEYHWIHSSNRENFARQLFGPNSGPLDAQGHIPSLTIGADVRQRNTDGDAQQLDFSQEVDTGNIRNRIVAGLEWSRNRDTTIRAAIDPSKAPTRTEPNGTVTTGLATTQYYFPFTEPLYPLSTTVAGALTGTPGIPNEYQSWYASYRATAFNDKLNLLAGLRSVKQLTSNSTAYGDSELTKTFGAIGEVSHGLYLFGSYNTDFVFSQGYTVNDASGRPIPGEGVPLGPETGKGLEGGVKLTVLDDKITGTISYFRVERNGVATSDIARNGSDPRNLDTDPNNDVRFNLNGGLQRTAGIDGDLVWTPNRNFQVLANFTYMSEARIISDPSINTVNIGVSADNARLYDKEFNHRLAKAPVFASDLVAKYFFTDGSLKGAYVGGAVRYKGKYSLSDDFNYDIYILAETKFDAFAGYTTKFWKIPTTFQVNLQNIGNKINDFTRDDGFVVRGRISLEF